MRIEDLTQEQVEQFRGCKAYEELMAHANEIGLELDEDQAEALRLLFEDPEAFAARVEQAFAANEDADITEDELKAVAGGRDQSAYAVTIAEICDPARWRNEAMKYSNYFNWL